MKKICFFILFASLALACKKDGSGSGSGKMLLSKEFFNGLLQIEYIYSTGGNLIRLNNYTVGGGLSTLSSYRLYEYDVNNNIRQVYHFSKEYNPTVRRVFTWSPQGRVTRIDEATSFDGDDDLDNMDYFEVFAYDVNGQLGSVTRREMNYAMHSITEYTYDDKGCLATFKSTYSDNGDMVLKQQMEIDPDAKPVPEYWKELLVLPTDMGLYEHYITGQKYTSYWSGPIGAVSNWTYIDRQYNNQGYLTKQTERLESSGSVNMNERTFEYVQQ